MCVCVCVWGATLYVGGSTGHLTVCKLRVDSVEAEGEPVVLNTAVGIKVEGRGAILIRDGHGARPIHACIANLDVVAA